MSSLSVHLAALIAPAAPTARRYYIMGAHSLPGGSAFAVAHSQQHLLTDFAMGHISVKQVVDALTINSVAPPASAALI